jgi:hypothetical protein
MPLRQRIAHRKLRYEKKRKAPRKRRCQALPEDENKEVKAISLV